MRTLQTHNTPNIALFKHFQEIKAPEFHLEKGEKFILGVFEKGDKA